MTNNPLSATICLHRIIHAAPAKVFEAWTTHEELKKWFGPEHCEIVSAQIDLRVDGEYHFYLQSQGHKFELCGVYREVSPSKKLVYTWNWKGMSELEVGESLVHVEFVEQNGATEVQLTHEQLSTAETRDQHLCGWKVSLARLEKAFAPQDYSTKPGVGRFVWNELLTGDTAAAAKFYGALFGWKTEHAPVATPYIYFKNKDQVAGGMMKFPREGMTPHWLPYINVENADAIVDQTTKLSGQICVPAFDIPNVGRIAILLDPEGAKFGIIQPAMS